MLSNGMGIKLRFLKPSIVKLSKNTQKKKIGRNIKRVPKNLKAEDDFAIKKTSEMAISVI